MAFEGLISHFTKFLFCQRLMGKVDLELETSNTVDVQLLESVARELVGWDCMNQSTS